MARRLFFIFCRAPSNAPVPAKRALSFASSLYLGIYIVAPTTRKLYCARVVVDRGKLRKLGSCDRTRRGLYALLLSGYYRNLTGLTAVMS